MKITLAAFLTIISFFGFTQSNRYFDGEIIVKVKSQLGDKCQEKAIKIPEIEKLIYKSAITEIKKKFPTHTSPKQTKNGENLIDLSTIYLFKIDPLADADKLLSSLKKSDAIEYAERIVINELTYTPNDTLNGSQWYLQAIDAFRAWGIQQGDTNVIIAFTDTGTDTDHPDMVDNYAYNYNDLSLIHI